MDAIVLDVETTGFSDVTDRVIEIAVVRFHDQEILLNQLINPRRPIPGEISLLTKIIDEMVMYAPPFEEVARDVACMIESTGAVVGHNPWFDQRMLNAEFARCDIIVKWPTLICTKRVWDVNEPRESRHLTNAYKRFVDQKGFDGAHGALSDTLACAKVFQSQIETFKLQGLSPKDLDPERSRWFGNSEHIVWNEGVLTFNVGKHKGTPCHFIDSGFWKWLISKDFPEHVKDVAEFIMTKKPSAGELASWAYGRNVT